MLYERHSCCHCHGNRDKSRTRSALKSTFSALTQTPQRLGHLFPTSSPQQVWLLQVGSAGTSVMTERRPLPLLATGSVKPSGEWRTDAHSTGKTGSWNLLGKSEQRSHDWPFMGCIVSAVNHLAGFMFENERKKVVQTLIKYYILRRFSHLFFLSKIILTPFCYGTSHYQLYDK